MLNAMVTASRASGIHRLNLEHTGKIENEIIQRVDKREFPVLRLYVYPEDSVLCVI